MVDRSKAENSRSKKVASPKLAPVAEPVKQATHPLAQNTATLARALAVLNGEVVKVPGVKEEQKQVDQTYRKLTASKIKLKQAVLIQLPKSIVFCLVADQFAAPVKWVKLFNSDTANPFLCSAGSHLPASLGQEDRALVAWFQGVESSNAECKLQIVFEDNTFLQFKITVQRFDKNTNPLLFAPFTQASRSVRALLTQDTNEKSEFRGFVRSLVDQESKANNPHQGKVDEIIGGIAEGWVWCPNKPELRYEVQAWQGDLLVGYAMADRFRSDLEAANKDNGRIKFEIVLSKRLFDGQSHTLQFRVVDPATPHLHAVLSDQVPFKGPNRPKNPMLECLMGQDLDRKVSLALSNKVDAPLERAHLRFTMPKVSLHLENDETRQARELLLKAISECSNKALWQLKLAECEMLDREFERALTFYEETAALAKDFVWSQVGLGEALRQLGRTSEALSAFERAAKLAPTYAPVKSRIEKLRIDSLLSGELDTLNAEEIDGSIDYLMRICLTNPEDRRYTSILHDLQTRKSGLLISQAERKLKCIEIGSLRHARMLLEAANYRFNKVFKNV